MTFDEFMNRMLREFPDAEAGEDNFGQLIIYTGLTDLGDDIIPLSELGERGLRQCDGCGRIEDGGTYPDQDGRGFSECCQ